MPMPEDPDTVIRLTRRKKLLINRRYESIGISTDLMIALFFVSGSIMYFFDSTAMAARWVYLAGSIGFFARPVTRLARRTHLQHWEEEHGNGQGWASGSSYDY